MPSAMFSATVSDSNSEKCWNTMPMPSRRACAGLCIVTALAAPDDLAGVGPHDAVDDLDQRALAGAVFAEQRVDLVASDGQIDVGRWPDSRETA